MKLFAYIVSALIGFAIGHYVLEGAAAAFGSVLISYHLYLLLLVLIAKHEKGFSLPIGQTILTHLAFLVVVAGLPYLRTQIPFFSVVSLLIPGLAPFETTWLFGGQGKSAKTAEKAMRKLIDDAESDVTSALKIASAGTARPRCRRCRRRRPSSARNRRGKCRRCPRSRS